MEIMQFIGHHGTSSENTRLIEDDKFKPSSWGWNGKGVYFFENNKELAKEWAEYNYPNQDVSVLERFIKVDKDKLLDISKPGTEHNRKIQETRRMFLQKADKEGRVLKEPDEVIDCKIINMVAHVGGFDVVRNFTYT